MDCDRISQLETQIREGSVDRRKAALDELATYPSDAVVPLLTRLAAEPEFLCRRFAVMGLGNQRTPAALAALKSLLHREKDDNVLAEIANALFDFGEDSVPLLQALFERCHYWLTRQTIISVLMDSVQEDVLLAVIREALEDETQTVKETGILALGKLLKGAYQAEALTLLTQMAQDPFWRNRWRAATALTLASDPAAKPLLQELQQDENHYVVAAALEAALPDVA